MAIRHERFAEYGFVRANLGRSFALAAGFAAVYDLAMSLDGGAALWIPLRPQPAVRMSLAAGFPICLAGFAATVLAWVFFGLLCQKTQ